MEEPKNPSPPHKGSRGEKPRNESGKDASKNTVILSKTEYETLKTELDKAQEGCKSNLDGWQRERAEFANYKKRIDREYENQRKNLTGDIIKKYLIILDDLELALKNAPKENEGAAWAAGIELITRKLYGIIESEGIERISENKVEFDPNIHEAISHEEHPDFSSGEVIEVVRQGYRMGDRILRPAMVRVAR